jgi:hypothetical protein
MDTPASGVTFIVRLSPVHGGRLTGVVERVRTGEKQRFDGLDSLGAVLARAVAPAADPGGPDPPPEPRPASPEV